MVTLFFYDSPSERQQAKELMIKLVPVDKINKQQCSLVMMTICTFDGDLFQLVPAQERYTIGRRANKAYVPKSLKYTKFLFEHIAPLTNLSPCLGIEYY